MAELYRRRGFNATLTPASGDAGVDVFVARHDELGSSLSVIQCKRFAPDRKVGVGLVRELQGTLLGAGATAGVLLTTSFFTKARLRSRSDSNTSCRFRTITLSKPFSVCRPLAADSSLSLECKLHLPDVISWLIVSGTAAICAMRAPGHNPGRAASGWELAQIWVSTRETREWRSGAALLLSMQSGSAAMAKRRAATASVRSVEPLAAEPPHWQRPDSAPALASCPAIGESQDRVHRACRSWLSDSASQLSDADDRNRGDRVAGRGRPARYLPREGNRPLPLGLTIAFVAERKPALDEHVPLRVRLDRASRAISKHLVDSSFRPYGGC